MGSLDSHQKSFKMKGFFCFALVLLPLVFAVEKRFLFDSLDPAAILKALSSFDLDEIGYEVGSDATEAQCEAACKTTSLPDSPCPMLCTQFQEVAKGIHVTEANSTVSQ